MFAATLCELLYKVEDALRELRPDSSINRRLREAIDNLNLTVVGPLSKVEFFNLQYQINYFSISNHIFTIKNL